MKDLYVAKTSKTPAINFSTNGDFTMEGNCYPENSSEFYSQITSWLNEYFKEPRSNVNLTVDLKYVNTSSIKSILNMIIKIRTATNSNVKVSWLYELEDEDMLVTGEDLQGMCDITFDFIPKNESK